MVRSRTNAHERRRAEVQDRFGLLLVLLGGSFITLGFDGNTLGRIVAGMAQVAALVVAFAATEMRLAHRWLWVFAVGGVAATALIAAPGDVANGIGSLASTVVLLAILVAVLDRVLRHRRVTLQTLYGAVCAYILIGLMFASVYGALDDLAAAPVFGEPVGRSVYSYYSFVTLTTVGYGDYTPHTDIARRLAVIEAVVGQLFIATTLARLVSLYRSADR